jgi:hypothetical protein
MLTEDMTRLSEEIVSMRRMRGSLMGHLHQDATERKQAVAEMCSQMGEARVAMARRTKNERMAFLSGLRRAVGAQCREMRNDLAGARRAWAGKAA